MLHVWTARISYPMVPDRLDITRRAAEKDPNGPGAPFAPSRLIVTWVRRGVIDWDGRIGSYVELYTDEMRKSYVQNRAAWDALLARSEVTLCCFCTQHLLCHRSLLARILERLGAVYHGERTLPYDVKSRAGVQMTLDVGIGGKP